jgi:hydroxymethylpyrimidine pyrophosphatase-like HAD family hydrolase
MIIACDFDGTICSNQPEEGYRMGVPEPGAILCLTKLVEQGNQIVVFTARNVNRPDVYKAVEDWLKHFKIPYNGITNIKQPYFDVMLDNRGLRFRGWDRAYAGLTT